MHKKVHLATNGTLGILMVVFGLNKFLGFLPVVPPTDPTAQQFLGTMFTSYLYIAVAVAEIIGGIFFLLPKTQLLGWLILLPVVFNIVAFHLAHDFIGNGIWILPVLLFTVSGYSQRNMLRPIINSKPNGEE